MSFERQTVSFDRRVQFQDKSHADLLQECLMSLRRSGQHLDDFLNNLEYYINNREHYIVHHSNKYVLINKTGLCVTDKDEKKGGFLLKIGSEFESVQNPISFNVSTPEAKRVKKR